MTLDDYPEFRPGQTLTAHELELLSAHLRHRDRRVGATVGFGVNAGLAGSFAGSTLTVTAGLAVDQVGEALVLPEDRDLPFPRDPHPDTFSFVDPAVDGFSVVLVATDVEQPPEACPEEGCAGHSALHRSGVDLRIVTGRVTGIRSDFASEELLGEEPLLLTGHSQPVGDYSALQDAVVHRLRDGTAPDHISEARIAELEATSIGAEDLPATRAYKAGWLNEVFFATLDLLRVEALLALGWPHTGTPPGVVLGHVRKQGSTWVFDCSWRHAWQPPRGSVEALLGGTCGDPAKLFRDRVESIIASYAPPAPPASGGGGSGGGGLIVLDPPLVRYPKFPPEVWEEPWRDIYIDPKVLDPIWNPPVNPLLDPAGGLIGELVTPVETIYGTAQDHVLDRGGSYEATILLGHDQQVALTAATDALTQLGGAGTVEILTEQEVDQRGGYRPAGSFKADDHLVLTVDAGNRVIATGIVPPTHDARRAGLLAGEAKGAVEEVRQVAGEMRVVAGEVRDVAVGVEEIASGLDGAVSTVKAELTASMVTMRSDLQGVIDRARSELGATITGLAQQVEGTYTVMDERVDAFAEQLSGQAKTLAGMQEMTNELVDVSRKLEQVEVLQAQQMQTSENVAFIYGAIGQEGGPKHPGRDGVIGRGPGIFSFEAASDLPRSSTLLGEFSQTLVEALDTVKEAENPQFPRYVGALRRSQARFEVAVASQDADEVSTAVYELLDSMRTAVKAAGIDPALGSRIDAQVREMREHLR